MSSIRHLHSSSRFDRSPLSLLTMVKAYLGLVDLITLTEVAGNPRVKALRHLPGWTFVQVDGPYNSGRDECAVLVRDAALSVLSFEAVKLSDLPIPGRGTHKTHCLNVALQTKALERFVVSVVHLNAHLSDPAQQRGWDDSTRAWARVLKTAQGKGFHIIAAADFNIDFKAKHNRDKVQALFPSLRSSWGRAKSLPVKGTHGSRLIDDSWSTLGLVSGPRLVNTFKSSDHTAYMETLAFPKETPVTGLCPFANHKLIAPGSNDPAIKPRVAILHVDAGNAESLYRYFNGPSGGIESHFFIRRDGVIEQYRSIYRQADANHLANDFAVSIETQGFGEGEWTPNQLDSIKRLLTWLNAEAGIPLRKVATWDGSGVGYHVQFGAPGKWTPVSKSCPGPKRISQFNRVLVAWMSTQGKPVPKPPAPKRPRFTLIHHTAASVAADKSASRRERAAARCVVALMAPFLKAGK